MKYRVIQIDDPNLCYYTFRVDVNEQGFWETLAESTSWTKHECIEYVDSRAPLSVTEKIVYER
jgi:hypothetical protein